MLLQADIISKTPETKLVQYPSWSHVLRHILCDHGDERWPMFRCIIGKCDKCGLALLKWSVEEVTTEQKMDWQTYGYVPCSSSGKKKIDFIDRHGTRADFINEYQAQLLIIRRHDFESRWLFLCLSVRHQKMGRSTINLHPDFQQNHQLKYHTELQSDHWNHASITIHTMPATFFANSTDTIPDRCIFFHLSDLKEHNPSFIGVTIRDALDSIQTTTDINICRIDFGSDGCSSQYKGSKALYGMSMLAIERHVIIDWCFSAPGHGKGVGDGLGGALKRFLDSHTNKPDSDVVRGSSTTPAKVPLISFSCGLIFNYSSDFRLVLTFFEDIGPLQP